MDEAVLEPKDKRTKNEADENQDPNDKLEQKTLAKDEKMNDKVNPKQKPHCK